MRLIDADELTEKVWRFGLGTREDIANLVCSMPTIATECDKCKSKMAFQIAKMAYEDRRLDESPTISHVVRCKDCIWFDSPRVCWRHGRFVENSNWFCADGERRRG